MPIVGNSRNKFRFSGALTTALSSLPKNPTLIINIINKSIKNKILNKYIFAYASCISELLKIYK